MNNVIDLESACKFVENIQPYRVDRYVDKIQVWLETPLAPSQLKRLNRQCDGRLEAFNEWMRYDVGYKQRLQVMQPKPRALRVLSRLQGSLLNGVEISLDWVFKTRQECDEVFHFVCCHHVIRHHGDQVVRWEKHGNTRYTGDQGAPNLLVAYRDKPSRIDRAENCAHFDWRINGVKALRRAGIESVMDLIGFDYRTFWTERLLLATIEQNRFGRMYHQHVMGLGRRRAAWIKCIVPIEINRDVRAAYVILQDEKEVQKVIDKYRRQMDMQACLQTIEVPARLLPRLRQRPVTGVDKSVSLGVVGVEDGIIRSKSGECVGESKDLGRVKGGLPI